MNEFSLPSSSTYYLSLYVQKAMLDAPTPACQCPVTNPLFPTRLAGKPATQAALTKETRYTHKSEVLATTWAEVNWKSSISPTESNRSLWKRSIRSRTDGHYDSDGNSLQLSTICSAWKSWRGFRAAKCFELAAEKLPSLPFVLKHSFTTKTSDRWQKNINSV